MSAGGNIRKRPTNCPSGPVQTVIIKTPQKPENINLINSLNTSKLKSKTETQSINTGSRAYLGLDGPDRTH